MVWSCVLLALLLAGPFLRGEVRLAPVSIQDFLIVPDETSDLVFEVLGDNAPGSFQYRVREYDGGERYRSTAAVEEGRVTVSLDRRSGYHELYFPETEQVFGIGALHPYQGERDGFFGIDAGLSWMAGEERREELIANLARGGIGVARERLDWRALNPRPGSWNWFARQTRVHPYPGGYERVRITYGEYGIEVIDPFFMVPDWMRASEDRHAYPDDLGSTSDGWRTIGAQWEGYLSGIEAWSRPDQDFGRFLPADQYVPLVKAVRHGLDRARVGTPLGSGGFSTVNRPFLDLAAKNGLLEELDYVSFHYHGDPLWMEERVGAFRSWLAEHGRTGLPLWITESEASLAGLEGRPRLQVERSRAMRYVMNAVEAKATGVERHFPSVYTRPEVEDRNGAMTDEFGVPLRSLVAYFHAVKALAHREYVGDLVLPGSPLKRARVFHGGGEEALIVLYTGYPTWTQAVELPVEVGRGRTIDGRELRVTGARSVTVTDGLAYVWASFAEIERHLDRETRTAELLAGSREDPGERAPASPVVLQTRPGFAESISANQIGYFVAEGSDTFTLPVRVHNLGPRTAQLRLQAREYQDSTTLESHRLTVPGNAVRDVDFELPVAGLSPETGISRVEVRADESNLGQVAPLVVNLMPPTGIDDYLDRYARRQEVRLGDLERRAQIVTTNGVDGTTMLVTRDGFLRISAGFQQAGSSALNLDLYMPNTIEWTDVEAMLVRIRFDRPTMAKLQIRTAFGTTHDAVNRMIKKDGEWAVFLFPLDTDHFQSRHGMTTRQVEMMRNGLFPVERVSLEFVHLDEETSGNVLEIGDIVFVGGSRETRAEGN